MNESITITKGHLKAALQRWEQDNRDGKTRSVDETAALPIEQVAEESAAYLWGVLAEPVAA